jgi:hypothetical protein
MITKHEYRQIVCVISTVTIAPLYYRCRREGGTLYCGASPVVTISSVPKAQVFTSGGGKLLTNEHNAIFLWVIIMFDPDTLDELDLMKMTPEQLQQA